VEVEAGFAVVGYSHLGTLKSFKVIMDQVQNLDGSTVDMISYDKSFKESLLRKSCLIFCWENPKVPLCYSRPFEMLGVWFGWFKS